jgi:hypothetical protein
MPTQSGAHMLGRRPDQSAKLSGGRIYRQSIDEALESIDILSRRFHAALGEPGGYTRRRGLDRETSKELLHRHLRDQANAGCPMAELQQVLPGQSRAQIKRLLDELQREGRARLDGTRRWARWYPGSESGESDSGVSKSHREP